MEMGGIALNEYRLEDPYLKFVKTPTDTGYYAGDIILKNVGGYIFLQNAVDEEDYVASCVQSLLEPEDTLKEHIKALAVAIRTYTYYLLANNIYILPDSLPFWQYKGLGRVTPLVKEAVKETRGEILTYLGRPIHALVTHSTGGYTVPYEEIFNDTLDYSVAVEDSFAHLSPYYTWEVDLPASFIVQKLNIGKLDSLKVANFTPHLIPDSIIFYGDKVEIVKGTTLYQSLSPLLPSPLFTLTLEKDTLRFSGKGKGTLMGLPITSSREMAKRGKSYTETLSYFFPVADLVNVGNLR